MATHLSSPLRLTLLLLVTLAVTSACDPADFESFNRISKLRVLAFVVDPPEVAPGEEVSVSPVVGTAPDGGPLFWSWQLCLATRGPSEFFRCPERLGDDVPFPNVIASSQDEVFTFTQDLLDDGTLRQICEVLNSPAVTLPSFVELPVCEIGLPLRLVLRVCEGEPDCDDLDAEIASRTLVLLFDEEAARADRNVNPAIAGLMIDDQIVRAGEPTVIRLDDPERELQLTALVNAAVAQRFEPFARRGEPDAEVLEQLRLTWFSTAGDLGKGVGFFADGIATLEELQANTLSFADEPPAEPLTVGIWLVLRDNRQGAATIYREIIVEPAP